MRIWFSFHCLLGVRAGAHRAVEAGEAPAAMVINRNGNRLPEKVGPVEVEAVRSDPAPLTDGLAMMMPMTSSTSVPIFISVWTGKSRKG